MSGFGHGMGFARCYYQSGSDQSRSIIYILSVSVSGPLPDYLEGLMLGGLSNPSSTVMQPLQERGLPSGK
jgi:hypothetical protein